MRNAPAVSVILPTFNRAPFLRDAVSSIRSQSYENWELVIVDDGSTDSSRAVIEELLPDIAQPTQYVYQENKGAYGARNKGLEHARGEYIAFFDSDDLWMPHHLDRCMHASLYGRHQRMRPFPPLIAMHVRCDARRLQS